jgi:RNase P subunit RPR2
MKSLPRKIETIIEPEPVTVMRCESCHGVIMNGRSRTVLDDSGSLAITAWKCSNCGGVIEEIQILSRYGKGQPRRFGMQWHNNAEPDGLRGSRFTARRVTERRTRQLRRTHL